jgi:flagellar biosynthesis chaperone FliJ
MMGFKFQLQSVLDIKLKELEEAEIVERTIRNEITLREKRVNDLRDAYLLDRDQLNDAVRQAQLQQVKLFEISLEDKKFKIMEILRMLAQLRELLQHAKQRTLALRKKTKGLERIKDKRFVEHESRAERRLQQEIDSRSAMQTWSRNNRERA